MATITSSPWRSTAEGDEYKSRLSGRIPCLLRVRSVNAANTKVKSGGASQIPDSPIRSPPSNPTASSKASSVIMRPATLTGVATEMRRASERNSATHHFPDVPGLPVFMCSVLRITPFHWGRVPSWPPQPALSIRRPKHPESPDLALRPASPVTASGSPESGIGRG